MSLGHETKWVHGWVSRLVGRSVGLSVTNDQSDELYDTRVLPVSRPSGSTEGEQVAGCESWFWFLFVACFLFVSVAVPTGHALMQGVANVQTDRPWYLSNSTLTVTAILISDINASLPDLNASVTATITRPDSFVLLPFPLYDDGSHGDLVPSDGTYTSTYYLADYHPTGLYRVDVKADKEGVRKEGGCEFWVLEADRPLLIWNQTYGWSKKNMGLGVVPCGDGGFVIAGYTKSNASAGIMPDYVSSGDFDIYVLKIDYVGRKVWERTYGGYWDDRAVGIVPSGDGGFVVAGYVNRSTTSLEDRPAPRVCILKIDGQGDEVWERLFEPSWSTYIYCITACSDGGFLLGGFRGVEDGGRGWDVYVLKVDRDGGTVWEKTYGGIDDERAYGMIDSGDGGYVVVGSAFSGTGSDVYVLEIGAGGEVVWEKRYGLGEFDRGLSVARTGDGGFIVVGTTEPAGTAGYDGYLFKVDGDGEMVWEKTFGGSEDDLASSIIEYGGEFVVSGSTELVVPYETTSYTARPFLYLLRIDGEGEKVWEWVDGGEVAEEGGPLILTGDGAFLVIGRRGGPSSAAIPPNHYEGDVYLVKMADGPWTPVPEALGKITCGWVIILVIVVLFGRDDRSARTGHMGACLSLSAGTT